MYSVQTTFRIKNYGYDRRCKKDVYTDWYDSLEDAYQVFEEWVNGAENHEIDESERYLVSVMVCDENNGVLTAWVDFREIRSKGTKFSH